MKTLESAVASSPHEPAPGNPRLRSFFGAGFECSLIRRRSGHELDVLAATEHDLWAQEDYLRLREQGLRVAREGVRWNVIESRPGRYDFSSVAPVLRAAQATHTQVIWDLCHFGWPEHVDLFKPDFVSSLANFGAAFAAWLARSVQDPGFFVPVNEISFFSWACGEEGSLYPFATGRGLELKTQLVRAALAAMDAIWTVSPQARFLHVDPVIHVVADPRRPEEKAAAEAYRLSQFQAWDMVCGRAWPELGGAERYLGLVGVNFYPHNQWFYDLKGSRRVRKFRPLSRRHSSYRPFREMLAEVFERYRRPVFIAETGAEDRTRAAWLRYVCQETQAALSEGIPVVGICLYPILNHPGWVDDRHCHNALWDYPDENGDRDLYTPLANELQRWREVFEQDPAGAGNERPASARGHSN